MSDESIFAAALGKAPGLERRAFLDGACGSDDALRRRVERLLVADGQAGGMLERGPDAGPTDAPGPNGPPLLPERVFAGRFKLRQKLGRPVPKVIDFGIAKATGARLTDRSIYTEVGALVRTLEYMAPEQWDATPLPE
jgi:serine/threonine protein kinase